MRYLLSIMITLLLVSTLSVAQVSVVINTGNTVAVNSAVEMVIDGDWTNNGTLNATAGTVTFNGSGDQTVASGSGSFNNLTVNKAGGMLILSSSVAVENTLSMISGNIDAGTNTLTLGTTAEGTLAHTSGTVIGSFARFIDAGIGSRLFPVGTVASYRPLTVNYTTAPAAAGTITVTHDDTGSDAPIAPPLDDSGYDVDRRSGMFWNMAAAGISGGAYSLSLDGNGQAGVNTPAALRIVHSNAGSVFDLAGSHVNGSGTVANRSGISGNTFGFFYLGGNITDNPFSLTNTFLKAIASGWNMLGLPYVPANRHYQSVFPNATDNTLFGFNNAYFATDTLQTTEGYWLLFDNAESVSISGSFIGSSTLDLAAGWNMISGISADVALADVVDLGANIDPGTLFGFSNSYFATDTIKQGTGYWIFANNTGQITLNLPTTKSSSLASSNGSEAQRNNGSGKDSGSGSSNSSLAGESMRLGVQERYLAAKTVQQQLVETPMPALRISDAKGNSQTLRFNVKKALNLQAAAAEMVDESEAPTGPQFRLPPPAPGGAGVFDARFSGDKYAADEDEGVIHIQTSAYPVTISAENLSAIMADLDGGDQQYALREITGTNEAKTHLLSEGQFFEISNPQVKSLALIKVTTQNIPSEFRVQQNYPNPFNPTTTIKYDLPEKGKVDIIIYNTLGQTVKTLLSKEQEAGYYEAVWEATNDTGVKVASGTYFYRVKVGNPSTSSGQGYQAVKKMILLK